MTVTVERDDHVESLEALDEEARSEDRGTAESAEQAAEDGLVYSPPEQPPVEPGGSHDAVAVGLDVPNEDLLQDVLEALAANPATEHLGVRVRVAGGTVTLRGRVTSAADAEEVVGTVLGVSGVDDVEDDLVVGEYG